MNHIYGDYDPEFDGQQRWETEGGAFTPEELRLIRAALGPVRVPAARAIIRKIDQKLGQRESGPGGGGE